MQWANSTKRLVATAWGKESAMADLPYLRLVYIISKVFWRDYRSNRIWITSYFSFPSISLYSFPLNSFFLSFLFCSYYSLILGARIILSQVGPWQGCTISKWIMVLLKETRLLCLFITNKSSIDEIWLHHFRMRCPPFLLLQTLFPSLFSCLDVSVFHCKVCGC